MNRIHQIDAELRELEKQRQALVLEREKLVAAATAACTASSASELTPSEKIELFLSLFGCRKDVYPKLWENLKSGKKGYSPVCRNEWVPGVCQKPRVKCSECPHQKYPPLDEVAARNHLTGREVIGTYAIREDNSCIFLAADFDGAGWRDDICAFRDAARALGVEVALERSRSGNGGHAWIFFREPVPAKLARRFGTLIMAKTSSMRPTISLGSYDRFFPNQDSLPAGGFGNLIALPLQAKAREVGNSIFLNDELEPIQDQWGTLSKLLRVTDSELEEILEKEAPAASDEDRRPFEDRVLDVIPSAVKKGDFSGTLQCVRRAQLEIPTSDLPTSLVAGLKRLATLANPVFFEKQRLRFGTWNIPRFIFCGEVYPDRLVLPRGTLAEVTELVRKAGGSVHIDDQRPVADEIDMSFLGKLTAEQDAAVEAMLRHDDGVLLAHPGAGKTVMGCALIAARRVPTLVLVHRKPLMEQWCARLDQFLGLQKKQVGVLSADGNFNHAPVTVGTIQMQAKSPNPEALLAPFAQVIIDECHHVPAASFEAVMKSCPARHVLGLTATPTRKDGLQKILFLQCGAIRHRFNAVGDPTIERFLILRDIHLGLPPEELLMPVHQLWGLLANHEARNRMISSDIAEALNENRHCVVLSDRKEHLAVLEELLAKHGIEVQVFRMDGSMGKKARAAIFEQMDQCCADGTGFALLATSSLIGEGFDLPELDTLFLTLPISFKGRVIQYAGRLHRASEGKEAVRIYDYVEPEHPVTASMLRKRMVAYREMGYRMIEEDALMP